MNNDVVEVREVCVVVVVDVAMDDCETVGSCATADMIVVSTRLELLLLVLRINSCSVALHGLHKVW